MEENERALISKTFIESLLQVPVVLCGAEIPDVKERIGMYFPDFLKSNFPIFITDSMIRSLKLNVIYHITDFICLNFILLLYDNATKILIAGPYLTHQPDTAFCEEILQKNGNNLSLLMPLYQFCLSLSVVSNSVMLGAARTALQSITGLTDDIMYQHYQPQVDHRRDISNLSPEGVDEALRELLEYRYYYEKLMLQEVEHGNQELALKYFKKFTNASRSIVRTEDPIRTSKNLGFSLNTMLRKAAENAGIHPIYLNIISSNFAMLIENSNRMTELSEFKYQMISVYCRFVQKHRLAQYSPMIRKAITYIHIHLADALTLKKIANGINISPSYLSRIFNQEVEISISNYITQVRVEKASELLSFSKMSIQNIAFYVGFSDFNYFSRCFKKCKGTTPTAFRANSTVGA